MFCTKCGMKLRAEDKFCVRCGNAISRDEKPYEPAAVYREQAAAVQDIQESSAEPVVREKIRNNSSENQILQNSGVKPVLTDEDHEKQEGMGALMKNLEIHTHSIPKNTIAASEGKQKEKQELPELAYAGMFSEKKINSQANDSRNRDELGAPADEIRAENENVKTEPLENARTGTEAMPHSPVQERNLYVERKDFTGTGAVQAVQTAFNHHPASPIPLGNPQETELLSVFAGPNGEYYLSSWKKQYSMNWAAFLLTIFWMGYRKLYAPMVITAGSFILAGLAIAASGMYWLTAIAVPLCMGVTGFLADRIYLSHARQEIDRVLAVQTSWDERRQLIVSRGGTSYAGVLIAASVVIGYALISILIFSIL